MDTKIKRVLFDEIDDKLDSYLDELNSSALREAVVKARHFLKEEKLI